MQKNKFKFHCIFGADINNLINFVIRNDIEKIRELWIVNKLKILNYAIAVMSLAQEKAFAAIASSITSAREKYLLAFSLKMQKELMTVLSGILQD